MRAMSQAAAKAQEPSMEEILASIRRIIADDEGAKPASPSHPAATEPTATPATPSRAAVAGAGAVAAAVGEPAPMSQNDVDAVLAGFDRSSAYPTPPASTPAGDPRDVLELTAAMEAHTEFPASPPFGAVEAVSDAVFAKAEPDPGPGRAPPRAAASLRSQFHEAEEQPLLSNRATAAVATAFGSLAHTVLSQNARTLDDLVQEMLRPMLKSWLDDNLPTIVERLVRAEIERVSRGLG
jgi:uncharacterized protein